MKNLDVPSELLSPMILVTTGGKDNVSVVMMSMIGMRVMKHFLVTFVVMQVALQFVVMIRVHIFHVIMMMPMFVTLVVQAHEFTLPYYIL